MLYQMSDLIYFLLLLGGQHHDALIFYDVYLPRYIVCYLDLSGSFVDSISLYKPYILTPSTLKPPLEKIYTRYLET